MLLPQGLCTCYPVWSVCPTESHMSLSFLSWPNSHFLSEVPGDSEDKIATSSSHPVLLSFICFFFSSLAAITDCLAIWACHSMSQKWRLCCLFFFFFVIYCSSANAHNYASYKTPIPKFLLVCSGPVFIMNPWGEEFFFFAAFCPPCLLFFLPLSFLPPILLFFKKYFWEMLTRVLFAVTPVWGEVGGASVV